MRTMEKYTSMWFLNVFIVFILQFDLFSTRIKWLKIKFIIHV